MQWGVLAVPPSEGRGRRHHAGKCPGPAYLISHGGKQTRCLPLELGGAGAALMLTPGPGLQTIGGAGSSVHPPLDWVRRPLNEGTARLRNEKLIVSKHTLLHNEGLIESAVHSWSLCRRRTGNQYL